MSKWTKLAYGTSGFHADSELSVVSLVFVIFVATIGIIADADRVL